MNITDQKNQVSIYCPTCKKGNRRKKLFQGERIDFHTLRIIWEDIVLFKFTHPCEGCGATQIRRLYIGEAGNWREPKEFLKECVQYMQTHFKGQTFRAEAKQMERNNLKAERIKVFKNVEEKEGTFKKHIAFSTTYWQETENPD